MAQIQNKLAAELETAKHRKLEKKMVKKERKLAKERGIDRGKLSNSDTDMNKHGRSTVDLPSREVENRLSRSKRKSSRSPSRDGSGEGNSFSGRRGKSNASRSHENPGYRNGRDHSPRRDRVGRYTDVREDTSPSPTSSPSPTGKRYGLLSSARSSGVPGRANSGPKSLGPDSSLLSKKADEGRRREREKEALLSRSKRGGGSGGLTEEQRRERVRQMEEDATVNDAMRLNRIVTSAASRHGANNRGPVSGSGGAEAEARKGEFLREMRADVYNGSNVAGTLTGGWSMEERLNRNRHYVQKGTDLDGGAFMKR